MALEHTHITTALGELLLVGDDDSLVGLYFPGHRYPPPEGAIGTAVPASESPLFTETAHQLEAYLSGESTGFELPVRTRGDAFSASVWAMLREIPYGETTTYGALAQRLGNRALAQRVGQAVGHNPVSIVIPCHRVVGADGGLTGFAGGLARKQHLLELEEPLAAKAARLF